MPRPEDPVDEHRTLTELEQRTTVERVVVLTPDVDRHARDVLSILSDPSVLEHMVVDDVDGSFVEGLITNPETRLYVALNPSDEVIGTTTAASPPARIRVTDGVEIHIAMNSFLYGAVWPGLERQARRKPGERPGIGRQMVELVAYEEFEKRYLEQGKAVSAYWLRTLGNVHGWDRVNELCISLGLMPRFGYTNLVTLFRDGTNGVRSQTDYPGIEYHWPFLLYIYKRIQQEYETLKAIPVPPIMETYFREHIQQFLEMEQWINGQQEAARTRTPILRFPRYRESTP